MRDPRVHGAAESVQAHEADLAREASLLRWASYDLGDLARELHGVLGDPDLLASTVLHPSGVADVERHLLAALDGPHGLTSTSLQLLGRSAGLELAARTYDAADRGLAVLVQLQTWASDEVRDFVHDPWPPHNPLDELQEFVTDNTALVQEVVDHLPLMLVVGPVGILGPEVPGLGVDDAAALLGLLFPDHAGSASWERVSVADRPPKNVGELVHDLNGASKASSGAHPTIVVRRIDHPPPQPSTWVVDLPGTSQWDGPFSDSANPADTAGNLHSMAGERTAYQQAVLDAIRQAQVPKGEKVMLVGHSQGGMVAVQTAGTLVGSGYAVTHVLTAGSPVGGMTTPPSVQVLSLENSADVVPTLDGRTNPATPTRTTVTFTEQTGSIGGNHGIGSAYEPAAVWVDGAPDKAVKSWRDSASPFLDGTSMVSSTYAVNRS